ncbi:MAG TPA: hypothetical protein VFW85_05255 [Gaiellaceae bacterium]|nr:hypothetical protein [Gaiellaceae bacterium]
MDLLLATSRFERYVILAPAIVIGGGLVLGVLILMGRAFADSIREFGHPRLLLAGAVGLVAVVVVLTWLGVELPKE